MKCLATNKKLARYLTKLPYMVTLAVGLMILMTQDNFSWLPGGMTILFSLMLLKKDDHRLALGLWISLSASILCCSTNFVAFVPIIALLILLKDGVESGNDKLCLEWTMVLPVITALYAAFYLFLVVDIALDEVYLAWLGSLVMDTVLGRTIVVLLASVFAVTTGFASALLFNSTRIHLRVPHELVLFPRIMLNLLYRLRDLIFITIFAPFIYGVMESMFTDLVKLSLIPSLNILLSLVLGYEIISFVKNLAYGKLRSIHTYGGALALLLLTSYVVYVYLSGMSSALNRDLEMSIEMFNEMIMFMERVAKLYTLR
ncbi:MAG: hypothetical protein DRO12_01405 [Thermoprotei archaeon]|nr:MAG: hypothetical protein DRO12_01405 [Thermoprotei archaeon]